jgi:hypothetical protein
MKKISSVKANVNIKTRILIFTGLLVLFLVLSPVAFAGRVGPALKLVEFAFPTRYNAVEQNITYFYMVTNSGDVSLTGDINITDNVTGTTTQSTDGLEVGSMLTGISIHTITQADIDTGSVTNLANATGSFNNQPVISPQTVAIAFYKHPTDDRAHNSESNNGDYGRYYGPNYGTVFVPVPMMYSSEHYGKTNIPNSDSKGHKAKAHLSKHKHKHHTTKHHKTGKNHSK